MNSVKVERLKGSQASVYIDELANLRMKVFREYPYLYEGELKYEYDYLETYTKCKEFILVLATHNSKIVGASSAIPLEFEVPGCQKPFVDSGISLSDVFYFGETVLLPEYRGQGLYKHFFSERESAAREYGCRKAAFCGVSRDKEDPRRPENYVPIDSIWERFAYQRCPDLFTYFEWTEIGQSVKTAKKMQFWMKEL